MSGFETLIFEVKEEIAYITLNRPQVLNSHNVQMRDDMFEVFGAIRDDEDIRVVILKGAGEKAFCAGADLTEFLTAPPPTAAREVRLEKDLWKLMLGVPQPLIAALHGYVLGSGIEMALCCDVRIASEDAKFGLPEMGLGMIPAAGGTQTVPRLAGIGAALDMILTNKWIDAVSALKTRMVDRVVPRDKLYSETDKLAKKIVVKNKRAIINEKKAVVRGMDLSLTEGLDLEKRLAASHNIY